MARFLSQEWLEQARVVVDAETESAHPALRLQVIVTGTPDGDVRWYSMVEGGVVRDVGLGAVPEPDVTLTLSYPDAVSVQRGELDANVAFMQGRMKVSGDSGTLLALLSAARTPTTAVIRERLLAATEF
jgi:predicted lipid carrier protein YhbT